ncbi:hypothetical protein Tco_1338088 [Tanacetum coccineum]
MPRTLLPLHSPIWGVTDWDQEPRHDLEYSSRSLREAAKTVVRQTPRLQKETSYEQEDIQTRRTWLGRSLLQALEVQLHVYRLEVRRHDGTSAADDFAVQHIMLPKP